MESYAKDNIIYKIASLIPKGKVLRYKDLANISGIKNSRLVGKILHENPDQKNIPCHRIVNSRGLVAVNFAFGGGRAQRTLLEKEGVSFEYGRVLMLDFLWEPGKVFVKFINLFSEFGEPGAWPWYGTQTPHSAEEIAIGAILTQNTNWRNVEYALKNLREMDCCSISGIYNLGKVDYEALKKAVKPSGFYNQKAERLFRFCDFVISKYSTLKGFLKTPLDLARSQLLALNGIGPETADTILLYALNKPIFVIDNYTRKFVKKYNLTKENEYGGLKDFFEKNLPKRADIYKDYHALIIKWGKTNKPQR